MNNALNIEYIYSAEHSKALDMHLKKADKAYDELLDPGLSMTGWIDYPGKMSDEMFDRIQKMADRIREKFSAVVIVGIGGSYLGARAALDFVRDDSNGDGPDIFFAGMNLSSDYHEKVLERIENKDVALVIISKSGTTTETLVAGNIFSEYIEKKYGKNEKKNRIFLVTDPEHGRLREMADAEGLESLPVPEGIGGRFSVLTAVGLLPMAIAGIDIREIIRGAVSARDEELVRKSKKLAAVRNMFEDDGYAVELFADFNPYMTNLIQWLKQLYGESEGKEGKGMLPVNLEYTRELHSLGQFVQEGRQIFTETFVTVSEEQDHHRIPIPESWGISDRDMAMTELNAAAKKGVISAHSSDGIPIIDIEIPNRNAYSFGQTVYFLQLSCAVRGLMIGVDPFDQPGVEKYKQEIRKNLK